MRPELEAELRRRTRKMRPAGIEDGELPRDIIADMLARGLINSPKQAWRTLEKWRDYNYGVTLDLGWIEEEAGP